MPFPKPASCQACPGWAWGAEGFMPEPAGEGRLGVMLVGESLGEAEARQGQPFCGPAGFLLGQAFQRGGWQREDFWISNSLMCRPPNNKLKGAEYEGAVLAACAPHLDRHIRERKPKAIVALGATAMQRLLGLPWTAPLTGRKGWRGYATYSERYDAWVLPTYHPSFIQRGQPELLLPLIADIQHACEWAAGTLTPIEPTLLIDPPIGDFGGWAQAYLRAAATDPSLRLTVDIETPTKGTLEDEGWADPTYTILRVGLHWRGQEGVSIPFAMPYVAVLADLLAADHTLYLWNALYDLPRLRAAGLAVNGSIIDGMWMWHLLESDQPKALDHAAPLLCPEIPRWKHLAGDEPGRYSALDGVYEGLVCAKAEALLRQRQLWGTFDRHIRQLDMGPCQWMHDQGLLVDGARRGLEAQASAERREALVGRMQAVVPEALKPTKVYKMRPPEPEPGETWVTVVEEAEVKVCSVCGLVGATGEHTKRKRDNPCYKAEIRKERRGVERRALVSPFSPSAQQLKGYAEAKGHKLVTTRKKVNGFTFDDAALVTLGNRYPSDPLYGLVQDYREEEKLGSTYLGRPLEGGGWEGGLVTSPDGRIHTTFTHNPSTLRFSSVNPNLQNLPRKEEEPGPYDVVRELFKADPGCLLVEADFCLDPKARVIKQDLTWVNAEDIVVGDPVIGFDEDLSANKSHYLPAIVERIERIVRPRVRVVTTAGETIVSAEHKFVARLPGGRRKWVAAQDLKSTHLLAYFARPWETDESRDGGYLAGFLDGEGWVHNTKVGYAQNEGPTLDHVNSLVAARGLAFFRVESKATNASMYMSNMAGALEVLGRIRPQRLMAKSDRLWKGRRTWSKRSERVQVLRVDPLPDGEVIAIKTTTGTLISDGYLSHNCGIEAVLVGYFARSPEYIRLSRLGVHDFVLAHAIGRPDLVDINWSDADLKLALKQVKKLGNGLRPAIKTCVHGGNYVRGAFDISRLQRKLFPKPSDAQRLLDLYFGVCPAIQPWQRATVEEAHRQGYLQNPFGYPHRFWMAKAFERQGREWVATFGPDAKRAVAFRPQSTAAGIIREVMARLWEPEWLEGLGRYLRLQVHDSLLWCVPKGEVDRVLPLIPALMAAPVKALPLPAAWGMGPYLSVEVEVKVGECWGAMEEVGG